MSTDEWVCYMVERQAIPAIVDRIATAELERDRLWRIAVCPPERMEEMVAEVELLGTATPEACRAIDALNHRLDKQRATDQFRELRRQVRVAQDAAVLAINQRREFEDELAAIKREKTA